MKQYQISNWLFTHNNSQSNWQKDFNDHDWQSVTVPHDWSVHEPFSKENSSGTGYLSGGIGYYRAHYSLKELNLTGNEILTLRFEGIYKRAEIWVNGYHLGGRPSGYSEQRFDITEFIDYSTDSELQITVKVDHHDIADSRWYNGSGITRPVYLEIEQQVLLTPYSTKITTAALDYNSSATLNVTHQIENRSSRLVNIIVADSLSYTVTSDIVLTKSSALTLVPGEKQLLNYQLSVPNAKLWSPDTPNLYCLTTTIENLTTKNKSTYKKNVGIRTIKFNPETGFYINGINEKIKGICLHEDAGCFGTAVPEQVWRRRLHQLKSAGVNAIRMSHNPHSPLLYDLCDQLGFFVFDEAFDEWENPKNKWWQGHNIYPPKFEGYSHDFPNWYQSDLENMILRNQQHPSIIAWSIGNEIDYPNDPYAHPSFKEMTGNNDKNKPKTEREYNQARPDIRRLTTIANRLIEIVKNIDQTRPVTLAAAFPELSAKTGLLDNLDLIGYNYKEHLYSQDHQAFPNQSLIGSENSHSYSAWQAVKNNPYISGQFIWTGIDYLGEAAGWPIHGSGAGLLTLAGFAKEDFYLRKSWWTDTPMIHISTCQYQITDHPDWQQTVASWDYQVGQLVDIRIYSNCNNIQLYLGDRQLDAPHYDKKHGYYQTKINYVRETLKVIGSCNGHSVTSELLPTSSLAAIQSNLWQEPTSLNANLTKNNERIYQLELTTVDHNQQLVNTPIKITVNVINGHLLGLENGNLADCTTYTENYRNTFGGKLLVYFTTNNLHDVTLSLNSELGNQIVKF